MTLIFLLNGIKIMKNLNPEEYKSNNVLSINFEDFILNNKDTIQKISDHISYNINLNKNEFNFSKSQKNIGRYKENLKNSEIEIIENQLKEFLNY